MSARRGNRSNATRATVAVVLACLTPACAATDVVYFPDSSVVVCGCAKCGTTSLMAWIYKVTHNGKSWPYVGPPWIHSFSPRWGNTNVVLLNAKAQARVFADPTVLTVALVREPSERLLSSWQSKLQCEAGKRGEIDADGPAVIRTIAAVLGGAATITSRPPLPLFTVRMSRVVNRGCLYVHEYAALLDEVHRRHDPSHLDAHILPQQHGCFKSQPYQTWTFTTQAKYLSANDTALRRLSAAFLPGRPTVPFPHTHRSSVDQSAAGALFPKSRRVLRSLSAEERTAIGMPPLHAGDGPDYAGASAQAPTPKKNGRPDATWPGWDLNPHYRLKRR